MLVLLPLKQSLSVYVVQWTRFSRTIKELRTFIFTQPYGLAWKLNAGHATAE